MFCKCAVLWLNEQIYPVTNLKEFKKHICMSTVRGSPPTLWRTRGLQKTPLFFPSVAPCLCALLLGGEGSQLGVDPLIHMAVRGACNMFTCTQLIGVRYCTLWIAFCANSPLAGCRHTPWCVPRSMLCLGFGRSHDAGGDLQQCETKFGLQDVSSAVPQNRRAAFVLLFRLTPSSFQKPLGNVLVTV